MLGLQACLFKNITVAAFRIIAEHDEDAAKRGGLRPVMEKSCDFEFLWEPCFGHQKWLWTPEMTLDTRDDCGQLEQTVLWSD